MESRMDHSAAPDELRRLPVQRGPENEHVDDWAHDPDTEWNEFPDDWDPIEDGNPPPPDIAANERLVAMLCYVTLIALPFVFPVIVLLSPKRTQFQAFHAAQSLGMGLCCSLFWIGLFMANMLALAVNTGLGVVMFAAALCLGPFTWLLSVLLVLLYAYRAFQGQYAAIPVLYDFMRGQDWIPAPGP